jgi:hypothetical protein
MPKTEQIESTKKAILDKYKFRFVHFLNLLPYAKRAEVNKNMPVILGISLKTWREKLYARRNSEVDVKGQILKKFSETITKELQKKVSVDDLFNEPPAKTKNLANDRIGLH